MDARQNSATLPAQHGVDYEAFVRDARLEGANVAFYLRKHLPSQWRELYVAAVSRLTNIVRFPVALSNTFSTSTPISK